MTTRVLAAILAVVCLGEVGCSAVADGAPDGGDSGTRDDSGGDGGGDGGARDTGPPGCTTDDDGDGMIATACGGTDCDDTNRNVSPLQPEICDAANVDEDCNPTTLGFRDQDHDGYVDIACCNGDHCGTDCDDVRDVVHPSATEACDSFDNDCDTAIDEGVQLAFFADCDGDGYGEGVTSNLACAPADLAPCGGHPPVIDHGDCDDTVDFVHPGATEICDPGASPADENCDGAHNEGCLCTVDQTMACCGDRGTQTCVGGTWAPCPVLATTEVCNGIDDDCDGQVDEGVMTLCYTDADQDGFAPLSATTNMRCGGCPSGETSLAPSPGTQDCNDTPGSGVAYNPGRATQAQCNLDLDCDGNACENVACCSGSRSCSLACSRPGTSSCDGTSCGYSALCVPSARSWGPWNGSAVSHACTGVVSGTSFCAQRSTAGECAIAYGSGISNMFMGGQYRMTITWREQSGAGVLGAVRAHLMIQAYDWSILHEQFVTRPTGTPTASQATLDFTLSTCQAVMANVNIESVSNGGRPIQPIDVCIDSIRVDYVGPT